jgi:hypothetical protein
MAVSITDIVVAGYHKSEKYSDALFALVKTYAKRVALDFGVVVTLVVLVLIAYWLMR